MPQQTTKQYFTALAVLHTALTTGVTVFSVIAYFLYGAVASNNSEELRDIFLYMVPVLAIVGVVAGNRL